MRVRFLTLGESRQHTISSIQQARHECEFRRVCEPSGPTTSSLLPLGHSPTLGHPPTPLGCCKPLGYPWRCPGLELGLPYSLAGAGAPWQWFLSSHSWSNAHFHILAWVTSPPSQKHCPQLPRQLVEGCASRHEELAKSGHQGVRSSHCQHREPSSCQKSIQNKQTPFWGGKILLAESGWWQHAADCQMRKGINKIMLALKNCVTTWEEQPLSIIGTVPGQEITASVLQTLSILSFLCFLSLMRGDEMSQLMLGGSTAALWRSSLELTESSGNKLQCII